MGNSGPLNQQLCSGVKTIDFYILKEWLVWFLACLGFLLSTMCLFSIADDPGNVFPRGYESIAKDLLNWSWAYLPWLLPICSLLAGLFLLGFLKKHGEWKAIQSNGISYVICFRSVVILGIGISYFCWWVSSNPLFEKTGSVRAKEGAGSLIMQVEGKRMWYFSSFDQATMTGYGVQLFQYGNAGEDVFRIRADQASWNLHSGWTFNEGKFLGFLSNHGVPLPNEEGKGLLWEHPQKRGSFAPSLGSKSPQINKSFVQLRPGLNDDPSPYLLLRQKPKNLSYPQLDILLDQFPNSKKPIIFPYRLKRAQLLWTGPACMVALLSGLVLGVSNFSTSPGKLGGLALIGALCFYVVRTFSDTLAEAGMIEPGTGAGLPYMITLGAAFMLARLRD